MKTYGQHNLCHEQEQKPAAQMVRVFPRGQVKSVEDIGMESKYFDLAKTPK
jgi:hypothetical protein